MKKALPIIIAILLILIVAGTYAGKLLIDRFAYSSEKADLNEYFNLTDDSQVAVVLQEELMDFKALRIEGYCYLDINTVHDYLNERFYLDETEQLIIYVEPLQITTTRIGSSRYDVDGEEYSTAFVPARYVGDELYLACDYVKQFTNYQYTYYENPSRMQMYTSWGSRDIAYIKKDTQIRKRGGVKSPVLKEVAAGDKVQILDAMDEWTCVKTDDCFIGYVENKRLENYGTEEPIPVTDYVEPEFTSQSRETKINMAWHNVAGSAGNDTIYGLLEKTQGVNVVSPTWFDLSDNTGNISDIGSSSYVEAMHQKNIEVWAVVSNFINPDTDSHAVLSATTTRRNLITNIMAMVAKYGLDGINIDFEGLGVDTGQPFIQFVRELSVKCRQQGIVLSVDNYVPIGNTDFYNRAEQGVYADYVVIMGYDEHYAGSSEAGSVASIGYVENGIKKTIEEVPASKVINGIPFYTRIWETNGTDVTSQAVGMELANQYVANHGITLKWDEETCQNYGEYMSGDTLCQIWMEDAESISAKLNVMEVNGIAGVAEWSLGFETPDIWDVISGYTK